MWRWFTALLYAILLFLGTGPAALAHRPLWGEPLGPLEIPNLNTSFAAYRELNAAEALDVYHFEAQAGDHLHAGINIPAIAGLEDYGVSVAVFGPGLPQADHELLPPQHPEDLGAVVYPSRPGDDFFEPFTQTNYWGRQRVELTLPQTGTYYLVVWNPASRAGKYVLDTGTAEVFGPADLLQFPIWWVRVHAYFGHTPQMVGVVSALLAGLVFAAAWRWRARRATLTAVRAA